ncbi:MAG: AAA family ATPase [Clostridium sp.]|uniref:ParA family protein n=1 Tax=Anaerorhabdus sp. TaxID=1872524 RepID=UPI002FCAE5D6
MAKIIAVANQKGGVTKTTSTFNISAALAMKGKRVLMVDMDSQASLTISAGLEPLEVKYTVCDILEKASKPIEECIIKIEHIENLSIIPSIIDLAVLETELLSRPAREKILARALNQVDKDFDYIIIDCPPQLSILTMNGLAAADEVIIPVKTDYLAYRGLTQLKDTIEDIRLYVNEKIKVVGVIAALYEMQIVEDKEILAKLESEYNVIGVIKRAAVAKKGIYDGLPVVMQYSKSNIAKEYLNIADMIIKSAYERSEEI